MKAILIILVGMGLSFSVIAQAQQAPDAPDADESFSSFFLRITSGNHRYPGITFSAPADFQNSFLARFRENVWVGDQNQVVKRLEAKGVNLWSDWYKTETPLRLVIPGDAAFATFTADFAQARLAAGPACRTLDKLAGTPWREWTVPERALFTKIYVLTSHFFGGRRLIDFVADNFAFNSDQALSVLTVQILDHAAFVAAVRGLGWTGEVYFRGLTAPLPSDPSQKRVILDGDFLRDKTEFTVPLFQMLEYIGILTHELNHVFQDLDASRNGMDLQISSAAGALLIEGQAEYLAEQALQAAGQTLADPSALNLYTTKQAIGLMEKDAGAQFEFFPYRVGLPFAYSFYQTHASVPAATLRDAIYRTILGQRSLSDLATVR